MAKVLEAKVPVVSVNLCSHCESIIGKESVVNFTPEEIKLQLSKNPENFFEYRDVFKRSQYRKVNYNQRCNQC